ncbi:MAG: hypothetical protein NT138_12890 [Planctomycetales bacterium]|nr:hypothetical protein [Planctomycetales bacterium]
MREIIRTLASPGKAIILSSHILSEFEDISDQVGVPEAGRDYGEYGIAADPRLNPASVTRLCLPR